MSHASLFGRARYAALSRAPVLATARRSAEAQELMVACSASDLERSATPGGVGSVKQRRVLAVVVAVAVLSAVVGGWPVVR